MKRRFFLRSLALIVGGGAIAPHIWVPETPVLAQPFKPADYMGTWRFVSANGSILTYGNELITTSEVMEQLNKDGIYVTIKPETGFIQTGPRSLWKRETETRAYTEKVMGSKLFQL